VKLVSQTLAIPLPRPSTNAAGIVTLFFTDAVTGKPLRSEKWVRVNVPGKRRASYNCVLWYIEDVQRWVDSLAEDAA
jgi:hypothetical protein